MTNMDTIRASYEADLALVEDSKMLGDFWTKYLSKSGEIQKLMGRIKNNKRTGFNCKINPFFKTVFGINRSGGIVR